MVIVIAVVVVVVVVVVARDDYYNMRFVRVDNQLRSELVAYSIKDTQNIICQYK